ncbi:MAG: insulinase family protein [Bacteroidota bacterium]|nr:insulinase family protein [Bacteroidota bacterium]
MEIKEIDTVENQHLYFQQDLRVPMTSLSLVFHGGGIQQESEEKAGLARMTAKMLFRGTRAMPREELSEKFELLGADVNAAVSETDFAINISCFTKNLEEVLALVRTVMNEASFPQEELGLVRKQELNQMDAALQEPERVLNAGNQYVLFGGTRLGKIGSRSGVNAVAREDVLNFFEKVRGTRVLYFTCISDLPQHEIAGRLSFFTNGRQTDGFALKPEVSFRDSHGLEAFIVESKGATNDRFIWTQRGIAANDGRRFDLQLVVDALGSFEGLLFDVLRNKNGWCYGAYGFIMQPTMRHGRIGFYSDPSSSSSEKLIPAMKRLLHEFPDDKEFQGRLAQRNATFKNRYAYQLDLKYKLSSEVNRDRYGIPILDQESYYKRIDAVTLQTARRTIGEVFDPKNMTMVFYGDVPRISSILKEMDAAVKITVMNNDVLVE